MHDPEHELSPGISPPVALSGRSEITQSFNFLVRVNKGAICCVLECVLDKSAFTCHFNPLAIFDITSADSVLWKSKYYIKP